MMKRNVYLNTIDPKELNDVLKGLFIPLRTETIPVKESLKRVTFHPVIAQISSPYYNASAMDGVAVNVSDTAEASEVHPVELITFEYINTGNPIPAEYNAVIMIEDIQETKAGVQIIKPAKLYQHIRPIGEDVVQGELIIPKNHTIRPMDIGAMIAGGVTKLEVIQKPKVSIIPTGSEIIDDPKNIEVGKILDSNSYFVKNALTELGADPKVVSVQKDEYGTLKHTILVETKQSDVVVIGAGSSAGSKDYTKAIVEELGTVLVHGINIKPGKPTIIGIIDECVVIGLPGYPVSTYVSFDMVIKPLLESMLHQKTKRKVVKAKLAKKVYSSLKHHEYVRVKLGVVDDQLICTPLDRGAGVTMSLVKADGILTIPKDVEGFEVGLVDVELLREDYVNTIVSIGSHDIAMDFIDELLSEIGYRLSSSHVGSFGGVIAMKKGECHIAPVHVLEDGQYNKHLIEKYDLDAELIKGIKRIQGIVVKKGNPLNIQSIEDLVGVEFVNRQAGSGTRILFDKLLEDHNIKSASIQGYDYELTTHMTVASAVKMGRADAGVCTKVVADLMDLDFIELQSEEYDFLVKKSFTKTDAFTVFEKVLEDERFIQKLGNGYQK